VAGVAAMQHEPADQRQHHGDQSAAPERFDGAAGGVAEEVGKQRSSTARSTSFISSSAKLAPRQRLTIHGECSVR
jgi:hypothetical protein